jgi:DNA gyrase subunit A
MWCSTSSGATPRRSRASRPTCSPFAAAPEVLALRDILAAFIRFREEVITRRTKFELNKARDRAHICCSASWLPSPTSTRWCGSSGLFEPRRGARSAAGARMADGEIAPYIRLVEAIETELSRAAPIACPSAGPRDPRPAPPPPDRAGPRRNRRRAQRAGHRNRGISLDPGRPGEALRRDARGIGRGARAFATPRVSVIAGGRRHRRRRPDRARGHGRHRHDGRLYQAHPALDLPRAEPRRQGPRRHGDQGRRRRHEHVRHQHPQSGAVLLDAGKVYRLKVWRLPEGGPATRGRPMVNLLPLRSTRTRRSHRAAPARGRG